jgi:DNA-binding transcriptional regulator LsrR (DeoR family)
MFHVKISRPAPVRDALLHLLRRHPRDIGMTTAEIAVAMGRSTANINSYLSKACQYGYVVKISQRTAGPRPHELNRWRLPELRR